MRGRISASDAERQRQANTRMASCPANARGIAVGRIAQRGMRPCRDTGRRRYCGCRAARRRACSASAATSGERTASAVVTASRFGQRRADRINQQHRHVKTAAAARVRDRRAANGECASAVPRRTAAARQRPRKKAESGQARPASGNSIRPSTRYPAAPVPRHRSDVTATKDAGRRDARLHLVVAQMPRRSTCHARFAALATLSASALGRATRPLRAR